MIPVVSKQLSVVLVDYSASSFITGIHNSINLAVGCL